MSRPLTDLPSKAPVLAMLITALLFSTGGAAIKSVELNAWQIAGARSLIAAMCLWLFLPGARRGWTPLTWCVGVAYAATLILFVHANKLTTAASTIFLQSAAPLYVVALAPLLLREPLRRRDLLLVPALAVGLGLFFVGLDETSVTAPDPLRGDLLAIGSGVCYALVVLGLRVFGRRSLAEETGETEPGKTRSEPGAAAVVCGNLLAAVGCLPGALPPVSVSVADGLVLGYLGAIQIGLAYVLMVRAIRHLGALEASLLLLLEPALSPLWAFWAHGEAPSVWSWLGGAVLMGATAIHVVGTYQNRGFAGSDGPRANPGPD